MSDDPAEAFSTPGRGFKVSEPIVGHYNQTIGLVESSTAFTTTIWIDITDRTDLNNFHGENDIEARCLLTHEQATAFRDQLTWLLDNHYHHQMYGRPVNEDEMYPDEEDEDDD